MEKRKIVLLPKNAKLLEQMGENIKLARLRRTLSADMVAQRAGISRYTVWQIEKGSSGVSIAAYLQVLFVLGLEKDIMLVAKDDALGRKLQDAKLTVKERAPKSRKVLLFQNGR